MNRLINTILPGLIALSVMMMCSYTIQAQQVPLFNQYYQAKSLAYPSAGLFQENRYLSLIYRDQFGGLVGSPKNFGLAYTTSQKGRTAFSANVTTADIGFTSQVKISGGMGLKLFGQGNNGLSIGSQVGGSFFSLNEERVNPENPVDNALANLLGQSGSSLSLDVSLSYRNGNFSLDAAMPNVVNESLSDDAYIQINEDNVPNFIGGVSYGFDLNSKMTFRPYAGVRLRETIGAEIDVMAEFSYADKFRLFGGYRDNYGASAGVGIQVSPKLMFTYNYDLGQKNVPFLADGFNEFGLHLKLKKKENQTQELLTEGQEILDRINNEGIYDENLVNPEDKQKVLRYLSSLEEGKPRERNEKAEEALEAIFERIKADKIAESEASRQASLDKQRQEARQAKPEEDPVKAEEESPRTEKGVLPIEAKDSTATVTKPLVTEVATPAGQATTTPTEKEQAIQATLDLATKSISFKTNSIDLRLRSIPALNELFDMLQANPELRLALSGYTDNSGDPADNLRLSQARADRVKTYLINKGIAADRITAQGFGSANPISNNDYDWGRALNRRVEMEIIKN